jgi:hypothetical protein
MQQRPTWVRGMGRAFVAIACAGLVVAPAAAGKAATADGRPAAFRSHVAQVVIGLAGPVVAAAETGTITDGNDVRGRLDIRSGTQGMRRRSVVHTISTYGTWTGRLLRFQESRFLFIDFDTKAGPRADRIAVVFFYRRKLRAAMLSGRGRFLGWATASRPGSRSVTVRIPRRLLGTPLGYRWIAASEYTSSTVCPRGCLDRAPNRGTVLHDITPPTVSFAGLGVPASTSATIPFSLADKGGSQIRSWRLQERPFGQTTWSTIGTGTTSGSHTVSVTKAEGDNFEYRVVATDGGGNDSVSPVRRLSFPIDDASAQITYTGSWTTPGDSEDYLTTLHSTSDFAAPATFSITFQGTSIRIVARGSCGWGTTSIDALNTGQVAQLCDNEHRAIVFAANSLDAVQPHTFTFTLGGGDFGLDGVIVR